MFAYTTMPFNSEPEEFSQPHRSLWRHMRTSSDETKWFWPRSAFPKKQHKNVGDYQKLPILLLSIFDDIYHYSVCHARH
jgi:hypothetical protein